MHDPNVRSLVRIHQSIRDWIGLATCSLIVLAACVAILTGLAIT